MSYFVWAVGDASLRTRGRARPHPHARTPSAGLQSGLHETLKERASGWVHYNNFKERASRIATECV
jgi:hypothetical protein